MKAKYYDNVNVCPMSAFIKCLVRSDYRALVYEGEAEESELFILQDIFMQMQEKYSMALGDTESMLYLKYLREVNYDLADLNIAKTILNIAPNAWIDRFGKHLNKIFRVQFKWDATNRVEFAKVLRQWEMRISGLEMRIELKHHNIETIKKKLDRRKGGAPTEEDFQVVFNLMEEHFKVPVSETITVARYCDRYKRMTKQVSKKQYSYGR